MSHSQGEYAGWWARVGGYFIDYFVVAIPLAAIFAVLIGGGEGALIGVYAAGVIVPFIYSPVLMARGGARNGQTLGKQIANYRVVHESGQPMTFGKGFIRDGIGRGLLGFVPLYGLVDVLFPLWDSQKQAVHDKIGSTTVHKTR